MIPRLNRLRSPLLSISTRKPSCPSKGAQYASSESHSPSSAHRVDEDAPLSNDSASPSDEHQQLDDNCVQSITVAIRVKPLNEKETLYEQSLLRNTATDHSCAVEVTEQRIVQLHDLRCTASALSPRSPSGSIRAPTLYQFDHVFGVQDSNKEVHDSFSSSIVENLFSTRRSSTVICYGQTGSGKTWTLFGSSREAGICQLLIRDVFAKHESMQRTQPLEIDFEVSYVEVYNEIILDLLTSVPSSCKGGLQLRELANGNAMMCNLVKQKVSNEAQVDQLLSLGASNRAIASHCMNSNSSRSHAVFTLHIQFARGDRCTLTIVDLAGSERASKTHASKALLKEGAHINRSLLAFSSCMHALSTKSSHVPFRSSKLTRILKESLNGYSKTVLLCCVSASSEQLDESRETLAFGNRAKAIKVVVKNDAPVPRVMSDEERAAWQNEVEMLNSQVLLLSRQLSQTTSIPSSAQDASTDEVNEEQLDPLLNEIISESFLLRLQQHQGSSSTADDDSHGLSSPSSSNYRFNLSVNERLTNALSRLPQSEALTHLRSILAPACNATKYFVLYRLQCGETECEALESHWLRQNRLPPTTNEASTESYNYAFETPNETPPPNCRELNCRSVDLESHRQFLVADSVVNCATHADAELISTKNEHDEFKQNDENTRTKHQPIVSRRPHRRRTAGSQQIKDSLQLTLNFGKLQTSWSALQTPSE